MSDQTSRAGETAEPAAAPSGQSREPPRSSLTSLASTALPTRKGRSALLPRCRSLFSTLYLLVDELVMDLANRESPDLTWIAEDLAIGSRVLDDEWSAIADAGVRAVVDCRLEARDPVDLLHSLGITFLHLPTLDAGNFVIEQVVQGVSWVEAQLAEGRRTLIHCQAGKGRSVLIGAAVLTRRGLSPDAALAVIRERRPIITPTPGQIARLHEFAEQNARPG